MTFSARTRYLLVTLAVLTASVIEIVRGYRLLIVGLGAATFLLIGNLVMYLYGWRERAMRREARRNYWAGN